VLPDGTFPDYHQPVYFTIRFGRSRNAADLIGEYRSAGMFAGHGQNRSA